MELEVSKYLREYSRNIAGKEQLFMAAYAKALEVVPRQLCDNAGFDSTIILNKLRARHAEGEDLNEGKVGNRLNFCFLVMVEMWVAFVELQEKES